MTAATGQDVLVIGSRGQDGTLLTRHLTSLGQTVVGVTRQSHDVTNFKAVETLMAEVRPATVYYLAAEHGSSEGASSAADRVGGWERAWAVHVKGLLHFLELMAQRHPATRLFYAASSRVFGNPETATVDEQTPTRPTEVYGITKLAGVQACRSYRQNHGVFASCGYLFNHESPLRGAGYVTQRLARGAAEVKLGLRQQVAVASLNAVVDWGAAEDYVVAMTQILALPRADDFVIATGLGHSVWQWAEAAFGTVRLDWRAHVVEDTALRVVPRPAMLGDATKLARSTGWRTARDFDSLVRQMVESQLAALAGG